MSLILAIAFWFAFVVFVCGLGFKIHQYWKTEAPLLIPTTPAPKTGFGVVLRLAREVILFQSLFKSNRWIWLFGWLFHFSLLLILARHIWYFQEQPGYWVNLVQPYGRYAAYTLLIGLAGLLLRRIVVDRVRYISAPSDFLMLIMLIAIGASGLFMQQYAHPDVIAIRTFFVGLLHFNLQELPDSIILFVHLALVSLLVIIFPFSKLLHVPGVFFSPTLNQIDNSREVRHRPSWLKDND